MSRFLKLNEFGKKEINFDCLDSISAAVTAVNHVVVVRGPILAPAAELGHGLLEVPQLAPEVPLEVLHGPLVAGV